MHTSRLDAGWVARYRREQSHRIGGSQMILAVYGTKTLEPSLVV